MNEGSKKFDLKEVADALSEIMEKVKITAFPKFSALDNDRLLVVYSISNRAYRLICFARIASRKPSVVFACHHQRREAIPGGRAPRRGAAFRLTRFFLHLRRGA